MPLGTLDRTPPPFFKQGPSALSRLIFFTALAIFLMVADTRLRIAGPIRAVVATALYPVQWLALQPVHAAQSVAAHFASLRTAQESEAQVRQRLAQQAARAAQVEQLMLENARLRGLLDLRGRTTAIGEAAEVLYDAADPHIRRVVIDRGGRHGIAAGSPVLDDAGVLGQVTRVYPLISEVTLLVDRDHAIPLLNTRTGARNVGYGDPQTLGGSIELRFLAGNADIQAGDLLSTSGVDGVYPPGLQVARVAKVERRADSGFARIHATPLARMEGTRHVFVIKPISEQVPQRPPEAAPEPVKPRRARG